MNEKFLVSNQKIKKKHLILSKTNQLTKLVRSIIKKIKRSHISSLKSKRNYNLSLKNVNNFCNIKQRICDIFEPRHSAIYYLMNALCFNDSSVSQLL